MANRNIIVVGTSLGGWDALPQLTSALPPDLNAAVLIVQHMAPNQPSYLVERLHQAAPWKAKAAVDGETLQPGCIYVAVPDHHLMIQHNKIRLSRSPKESHARPSVDVLFRSAAYDAGPRVIGIVLTGQLDDGTAGLWAIKDRGGIAIVQSPQEAQYPSMPSSARKHVNVDYTLTLSEMPKLLQSLTREQLHPGELPVNEKLALETQIALDNKPFVDAVRRLGEPSFFTCPDCHGTMVAVKEGSIRRFRCHTGHGFSERALLDQSITKIEETLWWGLAQMEETEVLLRDLCKRNNIPPETATSYRNEIEDLRRISQRLHAMTRDPALSRQFEETTGG